MPQDARYARKWSVDALPSQQWQNREGAPFWGVTFLGVWFSAMTAM